MRRLLAVLLLSATFLRAADAILLQDDFPGHYPFRYDIDGDGRDEIVTWDGYEMWIYTQSDGPLPGKIYQPVRNPSYNESNYRATVSLPGWTK